MDGQFKQEAPLDSHPDERQEEFLMKWTKEKLNLLRPEFGSVLEIKPKDIGVSIGKFDHALVLFCDQCPAESANLDALARSNSEFLKSSNFILARIQCEAGSKSCDKIIGSDANYPLHILFRKGTIKRTLDSGVIDSPKLKLLVQDSREEDSSISRGVVNLSYDTFDTEVSKGIWFVDFFAPWCPHCQSLAPIWTKLAEKVGGKITIASVDCDKEVTLRSKYGIRGFPSLKLFIDGVHVDDYRGSRELDSLVAYAFKYAKDPITKVDYDKFVKIKKEMKFEVVFLYWSESNKWLKDLEIIAKKDILDYTFLNSADHKFAHEFNLELSKEYLIVFKDGRDNPIIQDLTIDTRSIQDVNLWIEKNKLPWILKLDYQNSVRIFSQKKYLIVLIYDGSIPHESYIDKLIQISKARKTQDESLFCVLDGNELLRYAQSTFKVQKSDMPAVLIVSPDGDEYYDRTSSNSKIQLTKYSIDATLVDAKAGHIKPKHIHGFIGKFAKSVRGGVPGILSFILNYPLQSIVLLVGSLTVTWYIVKWVSQEDVDTSVKND